MTDRPTGKLPRVPSLLDNWISLPGIILAVSSFFAAICLLVMDLFRGFSNPYMGILTYVVAPAFLTAGLALMAIGALWERRRRHKLRPGEIPAYPHIDFNVPRQRRAFIAVAVLTIVFLLMTALGSYRTYQFTDSVRFCGQVCHTIMKPEFTAYQESPHARVVCVDCHIGPGATWFVKSKLSGAYQVYAALTNKYSRPIPTPVTNLRPAQETCEKCHWPQKFFGAAERLYQHFLSDEHNSPWTIELLVKIGGGDPRFGPVGGIHWHMNISNKIEYVASDKARQVIPWVRQTDAQGKVTVYQSSEKPLTPEQLAAATPRKMDCIDCHNRPTHVYHSPVESVDLALGTGHISPKIPFIKQQAVLALTGKYATNDAALSGIAGALNKFYESKYPAFLKDNRASFARAVAEVQNIYAHNFFPEMKVDWRVYPNNLGHWESSGCYRCHDGKHESADGKIITRECTACHTIVAQGPPDKMESNLAGLEFKHPIESDAWKEMKCSECHDGTTPQ